ncbi:hypothetical protein ACFQH9_21900 [Pseudonocardia lutea]|jgi:hypothetical protein|uniref:DUF3137 domain-containing protein n=1 Tax=Pseudonocardia lutea TaxID=2172015 RepID=A0ABW1IDQ1_9PSEU
MGNFWLIVTGGMRAWWNQTRATLAPPPMPAPDPQAPTLGPPGDGRRKEWVHRYFRPSPARWEKLRAVRQMQVGGVLVLVGLSLLAVGLWPWALGFVGIATVFLVVGFAGWRAYHFGMQFAEAKPTGRHLDRTLNADLRKAMAEVLDRFGLTREDLILHAGPVHLPDARTVERGPGDPLVFAGPAPGAKHRPNTQDRIRRFTAYSVAVVCLAQHHLAVMTFELDLATGARKNVDTHEYHYDHVAAVNTSTRPAKELLAGDIYGFPAMKAKLTAQELEITSTGGTHVLISTEIAQEHPADLTITTSIKDALPQLRRLLRRLVG